MVKITTVKSKHSASGDVAILSLEAAILYILARVMEGYTFISPFGKLTGSLTKLKMFKYDEHLKLEIELLFESLRDDMTAIQALASAVVFIQTEKILRPNLLLLDKQYLRIARSSENSPYHFSTEDDPIYLGADLRRAVLITVCTPGREGHIKAMHCMDKEEAAKIAAARLKGTMDDITFNEICAHFLLPVQVLEEEANS